MVKQVVKESWQGLTASVEKRIEEFFNTVDKGFRDQGDNLKKVAQHPSGDDEKHATFIKLLEEATEALAQLSAPTEVKV